MELGAKWNISLLRVSRPNDRKQRIEPLHVLDAVIKPTADPKTLT